MKPLDANHVAIRYDKVLIAYQSPSAGMPARQTESEGASETKVPLSPVEAEKISNTPAGTNNPDVRYFKRIGVIECQTCKNRKYQDVSNDPGVSFKAPSHVSPESSGAAVMSHEREHVSRNQAKAAQENREVVYQSVKTFTAACPECGKTYTSGGETTTVTRSAGDSLSENMKKNLSKYYGMTIDTKV